MTDASLPARYESPSALAFLGYAAAIVIILWSFAGAGFSIDKVISSPPRFADFIDRAFPPNLEPKVLARLGWKMLETLQIALEWFGFYNSGIDGAFGPGTRAAMAAWQADQALEQTGILTTRQREDLLGAYARELNALQTRAITGSFSLR